MPHAEKNLSHYMHDSSVEPCLKKSRSDYSFSWTRETEEREGKSQKWTFSTVSEERCHQSNRCENEGGQGGVNVKYGPLSHHSGQGNVNERDSNKTNQHSFVVPKREKPENNFDVEFSGTSTSFIGPLCPPLAQDKPARQLVSNRNAKSSPYKIATVELGKSACKSKRRDGMDYELRQFYKELNELEAEASDQAKPDTCTDLDVKQHISPYPDNTPSPLTSNQHHGQVPTSQPSTPFPSPPSNLVSVACPAREDPRTQLERLLLPPNNLFSCDSQAPYHPTNYSFVSHATPPRFDSCPPPTFIVPHGPPPPRFSFPMYSPRPSNIQAPELCQSFNYDKRNESPPWPDSPVPPESHFTFQVIPYNEPSSQGTGERMWQDLQHNDLGRLEDGPFGEQILPPGSNVSREEDPFRFKDTSRKMMLLRGVPGSGKSTLARTLLRQSPDGVVLSTDDYFYQENGYTYDAKLLGDAHNWNHDRARRALDDGRSPVIIDNTNSQAWEMKPYVQMAVDRGYDIQFLEPDTWWKQDPEELEKRTTHRVPRETISKMLERYEYDVTVPDVMNSVDPRHSRPNRPPPEAHLRWGASVDCSDNSSSFHSR